MGTCCALQHSQSRLRLSCHCMGFCKPRGNEHTRHLFIGNTGPAVGVPLAQIEAELSRFGQVQHLTAPEPGQGRVFASFATTEDAEAVCGAGSAIAAALGGRRLTFKYAALESELQVQRSPAQAALGTAQVLRQGICTCSSATAWRMHGPLCTPGQQTRESQACSWSLTLYHLQRSRSAELLCVSRLLTVSGGGAS